MRDRLRLHLAGPKPLGRWATLVALSYCLCTVPTPQAMAAPGQLDDFFGGLFDLSVGSNVMCHAVAPDGKIVLAGSSGDGIVVTRRLANGYADLSFGGNGTVNITHPAGPLTAHSVAVQPDGRIVVAGSGDYGNYATDFLLIRLTHIGSLDYSFGGNGFASAWVSTHSNHPEKVLIQPDGKIVVAGYGRFAGDLDFAAARFNADGTLDTSFSGDGKVSIGFGGNELCFDAVLQADGKLVMVGSTEGIVLLDEDFALARLHVNGSLDNSFGGDGKIQTGFGDFYDRALAVAIQPTDQRIVVVGQGSLGGTGRAARYYSSDGSLDSSFDGDGKMSLPYVGHDVSVSMAGKISSIGSTSGVVWIHRMNSSGSDDVEWSGDGWVTVDTDVYEAPSLSFLSDGRLLAALPSGTNCRLYQYWADGSADDGGKQALAYDDATFPTGSHEIAQDMVVLDDGRTLVAGEVSTPGYTETDFALSRFLVDGQLDLSFGTKGRATLSLGNYDYARTMVVQPDGKIVVAGYTGSGNAVNFMIARFNASGSLDTSFGFGGYNAVDFLGGPDYGSALALDADGKILLAGTVYSGGSSLFGLARFRSNGTLDPTFDSDGKQMVEFTVGASHWASAMVVQSHGRIIVGGSVGGDFALLAFTTSGSVDTNFGVFGKASRDLGGSDYLEALVIGTDNRIYAAGTRVVNGNADWALTRWTALAGPFLCPGGVCPWTAAFVDFGASSGWANDLRVRSDGNLVIVGSVGSIARWSQFTPSSPTPIANGWVSYPGPASTGMAVGFSGWNKLMVAGTHTYQGDHNMTVTRFETLPNEAVSVEEPALVGPSIRMEAPFPNPLVGRSTFAFELPSGQKVQLAVFDVAGRRVRMLREGELPAGRHLDFWDGRDEDGQAVAAGIYYARLVAGAQQASAKIVVMR